MKHFKKFFEFELHYVTMNKRFQYLIRNIFYMTITIYTLPSGITGSPVVLAIIEVLIFILTSQLKNVTYFKSIFQLFYYYDICQFCSIPKKVIVRFRVII